MTRARDARATAGQIQTLLDEVKAGRLSCSAATRNRLEGAMLAMDVLALDEQADGLDQVEGHPEVGA